MKNLKDQIQQEKSYSRFYAVLQIDTKEVKENLKKFGLDYQKVEGLWENEKIIVWKTAYTFGQFKNIMLNLNAYFKQKVFCLGRNQDEVYDVKVYQTNSLEGINYEMVDHYCINDKENPIEFGKLQHKVCLEASECLMGAYKRDSLVKDLLASKEQK